jgi:dsDNA-binding SOS-regulon protein
MQEAYDKLCEMIADVAVKQTENHLEVLGLFKAQNVEMAKMQANIDQIRADGSSLKARVIASEVAADQRHEDLLEAIRASRGVPGMAFAR